MNKALFKRIICSMIGASFIGIGIAFFSLSNIGGDCVAVLYQAISDKFNITVGRSMFIISLIELLVPLTIDRKKIGFTTLFYVVFAQYIIDFFITIIPKQNTIFMGIVYTLIAIIIISIGSVFCLAASTGLSLYDAFCFSISDYFKIKYVYVRYAADALHLIVALMFGGLPGIGTIISLFMFAVSVDLLSKIFLNPLKTFLNK